jgi:hypothetical protein
LECGSSLPLFLKQPALLDLFSGNRPTQQPAQSLSRRRNRKKLPPQNFRRYK